MEHLQRFTFDYSRLPERLDCFLAAALPELSRSQLKRLIDEGRVTLNNAAVKASTKLKGGEEIAITLPEPVPTETLSQDIPLTVLYEDSQLIVIDKPAGVLELRRRREAAAHRSGPPHLDHSSWNGGARSHAAVADGRALSPDIR